MAKRKKAKAPKAISKSLNSFDRVTGAILGSVTGTVKRTNRTLKRLNKNLNRVGDAFDKFYEDHSGSNSNF